tara:strand:+ start:1261 stop:2145 length:885 start_codon:yes stop_codon:yes gene_type:complete
MTRSSNTNEYTYQWVADTYGDEDLPILKITKSSFGSFQWCPKKYQFSYIERLPQDTTEAMYKGTIIHNAREAFFDDFDIAKAEDMSHSELINYCLSLHPIDDYTEMYETMAIFEANRFIEAKEQNTLDDFIPVVNEVLLDAKITVGQYDNPKYTLKRDYTVHLQGIIDRMFYEDGSYIPMELKTGLWKDYKTTMMRKEMAFYKLLFENASDELLESANLDRNIPITHWGWYYPASNYLHMEKMKPSSVTSVKKGIAELIYAYEHGVFPTKYFARTCASCSFFGICDAANTESWL